MKVSYVTKPIFDGKHASLHIPDEVLERLGATRRAPVKVTINGHTYQSTSTGVGGECRVVFPQKERDACGVHEALEIEVTLELDSGVREVDVPEALAAALESSDLRPKFDALTYSARKEHARQVSDAKTDETREKRIAKVVAALKT